MLKIGDSMKRIFIVSSDPDECEWIKEELEDFGRVVKAIDSLDFFISQWESVESEILILTENVVKNTESFEKLLHNVKTNYPYVKMVFLYFRDADDFVRRLTDIGLICISYNALDVGVIEMRIKGELGQVPEVNTHTETEVAEKVTTDSVMFKRSEVDETLRDSTTEESEESSGSRQPMDEPGNVSIVEVGNTRKASDKLLKVLANKGNEFKTFLNKRNKQSSTLDIEGLNFDAVFNQSRNKVKVRDRYIGTAVIAVTGVEKGVGCTHTALMIANYLAKQKFSVALVEANESNEYKEIEAAYEGVDADLLNTVSFFINGVHYYKNESCIDMISLLSGNYSYIILDLGCYDTTSSFNEFLRANLQIVVGGSSEWKQNKIYTFFQSQIHLDQSKWRLCLPLAEKDSIKDISKKMDRRKIYRIPYFPDAFDLTSEIDGVMENILKVNQQHKLSLLRKKMLNIME
ncbi:hypothetical protein C0Q44_28545 [Paenibacillus sp. PCH8]|uniref:hypothetical protein n=1 Tax=Paenibacillus sp. PCH8 TaxID=2066524 RepID=UPI000CF9F178|nr:hypothetical protein [Paenibacillus sp. PCH8]PQP80363.1 hypothetical protein C0Q44_28545 [Paenibacillus sp. PCH8]